jgi:hypothetical protein
MGLRVLITNLHMWPPSGTVLYARDLALELQRQGHTPIVFSSTAGEIVEELHGAGVEVWDDLNRITAPPDVIHGHHHAPTMVALQRWPTVPAIFVCHDHTSAYDRAPIHPSIRRYYGVSRLCVRRLIDDGVPPSSTGLLLNFVDTARFSPRGALPKRPKRALVFSNYAKEGSHLAAIVEACREAELALDVVGAGNVVARPERLVWQYDIVFAKAKAAMEAMAVGTAVILCDYAGVGPMVTSAEFDGLRPLNFGFEALREPLRPEPLLREIARYDAVDARRVRDLLRSGAGLVPAVTALVAIYHDLIAENRSQPARSRVPRRSLREPLFLRLYWRWWSISPDRMEKFMSLPGTQRAIRAIGRILRGS